MVPFLKKYPWCTVLRLLLSLQQQLLPQVSPTQQQHQPIRFAPFKSFLSWIPELRISTLLQIHSTVAMAIAQSLEKSRTCAQIGAYSELTHWQIVVVLCCIIFSFCSACPCFVLMSRYPSSSTRTHTHRLKIDTPHSVLVWFPCTRPLCVRLGPQEAGGRGVALKALL